MKKGNFSWAFVLGLSLAWSPAALSNDGGYVGYHQDYRKAPKIIIDDIHKSLVGGDPVAVAKEYLATGASKFNWKPGHLELMKVKPSLTGTHVHFRQLRDGLPVRFGEVVISVDTANQSIYQVYNNFYSGKEGLNQKNKSIMSKERAFDIAWQDLKVHGKLQSQPEAELMYVVSAAGKFTRAYITQLNVDAPFGAWEHVIDAATGEVISTKDTRLERKRSDMAAMRDMYKGPVTDRQAAFQEFQQKASKTKSKSAPRRADASGLVFDPDPRTTLGDSSLQDTSAAELFDSAYVTAELLDLTMDGANYTLAGPWVTIADFESPSIAPSTTTDGVWSAQRGDVAFNDVMTYYHVDKNQRYMQTLGFTGEKSIQGASIEVDANGLGGADNSHYIPSSNRMAFGHGCVDDNEDADVILHEYGHAINYSINSSWGGGDSGAMGEGFGDYWAASYSISTPNGMEYEAEKVFNWDAHGDGNDCWPGRVLNALTLEYDHNRSYGPHNSMPGGHQTDELWSTPIFQALLTLQEMGVAREEVDQIILEAQFGLGAGLKMRDMANSVINTARRLQPEGPHAGVFFEKFAHHGIVDVPQAVLQAAEVTLLGTGSNGVIDPGEAISLSLAIHNRGTLEANSIEALLSTSTAMVEVSQGASRYPQIEIGTERVNETPFTFLVDPDFACGEKISLSVGLTFEGGPATSANIPLEFTTGLPQGVEANSTVEVPIPDNSDAGVDAMLAVEGDGTVTENLLIDINLEHTYIGDLKLVLVSPGGTQVVLHDQSGGSANDIVGTYGATLNPAEPLSVLVGEPLRGNWTLKAVDTAGSDVGSIKSWGIRDVSGYECE